MEALATSTDTYSAYRCVKEIYLSDTRREELIAKLEKLCGPDSELTTELFTNQVIVGQNPSEFKFVFEPTDSLA